ncbi:hypothetical protein [Pseudonocardia kunmingensis]|uniref:hypothetical protein n=1 Tax=Pseudonocardia kunmingensis TaxID=630975 RepID=UPI00115450E6|nr:hypothetical protein [Pseudonocardia kunmingensis]
MEPLTVSGGYDELGQLLPGAITQSRAMVREARADERSGAHDVAAQLHQLAACTLVHLGYPDVAHMALREALSLAAAGTDPLRVLRREPAPSRPLSQVNGTPELSMQDRTTLVFRSPAKPGPARQA